MSTEGIEKSNSKFEYLNTLNELELMRRPTNFKPRSISRKFKVLEAFKLIPGLGDILDQVGEAGDNFSSLVQLKDSFASAANVAQSSFHGLKLGLAIIDFIRIPAIFLAAALLGQKLPLTLSKAGQWAYAGSIVVLSALLIALPGAWPIVGLVTAGFILGSSIFTLGRLFYQRYQIKKQLTSTLEHINEETLQLDNLKVRANKLKEQLEQATDVDRIKLLQDFKELKREHDKQCESLQNLYDKKEIYAYKLAKRNTLAVLDKSVSVILAAGVFTGLILALFFPPLGFAVAATCAAVGAIYLIGRVLIPFLATKLGLTDKTGAKSNTLSANFKDDKDELELEELNTPHTVQARKVELKNDDLAQASSAAQSDLKIELKEEVSVKEHLNRSIHDLENSDAVIELALGVTPEQFKKAHPVQAPSKERVDDSITRHHDIYSVNSNQVVQPPQEESEGEGEGEKGDELQPS